MNNRIRHSLRFAVRSAGFVAGAALVAGLFAGCTALEDGIDRRPGSARPKSVSEVPAEAWGRETDRWIGTPYHRGGSDTGGADCSGFVQQVYLRVAGVDLPRITRDQSLVGFEVGRSDLRPGDLVFFETTGSGVSHVGLMVGGDRFAHASTSRGVMYSRLSEAYWLQRYLGARRLPRRTDRRRRWVRRNRSSPDILARANPLTPRKGSQHTPRLECR